MKKFLIILGSTFLALIVIGAIGIVFVAVRGAVFHTVRIGRSSGMRSQPKRIRMAASGKAGRKTSLVSPSVQLVQIRITFPSVVLVDASQRASVGRSQC